MTALAVDHPYYCNELNFYSNEPGAQYASWAEYIREWETMDKDLNLLFRWDWNVPDPRDYDEDDVPEGATLQLFFVLQRKGIFLCNEVKVSDADEPAVREYLQGYWEHMKLLWEPLS